MLKGLAFPNLCHQYSYNRFQVLTVDAYRGQGPRHRRQQQPRGVGHGHGRGHRQADQHDLSR